MFSPVSLFGPVADRPYNPACPPQPVPRQFGFGPGPFSTLSLPCPLMDSSIKTPVCPGCVSCSASLDLEPVSTLACPSHRFCPSLSPPALVLTLDCLTSQAFNYCRAFESLTSDNTRVTQLCTGLAAVSGSGRPTQVAKTTLRLDIVLVSKSTRNVVILELTQRMEKAIEKSITALLAKPTDETERQGAYPCRSDAASLQDSLSAELARHPALQAKGDL